jgi:hypothetical protein
LIRIEEFRSAALRAAAIAGFALLLATPQLAWAQDPAAAAPQADPLKLTATLPTILLFQIHADKTADFESAWGSMRAGFAKSTDANEKAFGESISKLFKVDQPPIEGKTTLYILQIDSPSTTITYNPFAVVYEVMWKNGKTDGALLTREEADAIYAKLKAAFQNVNPPWKLIKIG